MLSYCALPYQLTFHKRTVLRKAFIVIAVELSLNLAKMFCPVHIFSAMICPS